MLPPVHCTYKKGAAASLYKQAIAPVCFFNKVKPSLISPALKYL